MASINYAKRELECKIVYYGPGLCGKTTNLQTIHQKLPDDRRGDLSSVATQSDRTLFFDLLPLDAGQIKGFSLRVHLFTVPGQVYYNQSRKLVLQGADGVVFVADSQSDKMEENKESLENLYENLRTNRLDPDTIPLVFQYNKRDIPGAIELMQLNETLNPKLRPYFEAVATTGQGVFDTLKKITQIVVDDFKRTLFAEAEADGKVTAPAAAPTQSKEAPVAETVERKGGFSGWLSRLFGKRDAS